MSQYGPTDAADRQDNFLRQWGLDHVMSNADERELRERAMSHACYISPEMGAFGDEDSEYMTRLIKTADRIADWIKDGV